MKNKLLLAGTHLLALAVGLSPEFVETRADFLRLKSKMARVGDVQTFENFIIAVPAGIDPAKYGTVVVWCETFGMFTSSAKYR